MEIVIPAFRLPWWLRRYTPAPGERCLDSHGRYWLRVMAFPDDRFWRFRLTRRGDHAGEASLSEARPGVFRLDDIIVESKHRGQGLGTRMLEQVIALARKEGGAVLFGRVVPADIEENPWLLSWYKRIGFQEEPALEDRSLASVWLRL